MFYHNTPYIINKYRENKAYENYKGDKRGWNGYTLVSPDDTFNDEA
jgi:hypothetical protein